MPPITSAIHFWFVAGLVPLAWARARPPLLYGRLRGATVNGLFCDFTYSTLTCKPQGASTGARGIDL